MKSKMAGVVRSKLLFSHPLITILGCTGTGKSKLAIELAKKFNGEIINADAMQMYQGLDIITNKVTEEEQEGIRHHILGVLNPLINLTVCQYKEKAMQAIEDIISRKKLPIIVGGTFYYVESVLYDFLVGEPSDEEVPPRKRLKVEDYKELEAQMEELDNLSLHEKLKEVDPELAMVTHPNARRKLLRGIMAYYQHGEPLSSIFKRQRAQPGGSSSGGPLNFTNSLILWLQCDTDVLNQRLYDRVDGMLDRGLDKELLEFHRTYKGVAEDTGREGRRGILQAIGFKEFRDFLLLEDEERESEKGKKLFENGVESLKFATSKYAKNQVKWMKNRLMKDHQRQKPPIYTLDVTDLSKWNENVYKLAEDIVECHIAGKKPPVEPVCVEGTRDVIDKIYYCECGLSLVGISQYEVHRKSKNHQRLMKIKNKLKETEKKLEEETEEATSVPENATNYTFYFL